MMNEIRCLIADDEPIARDIIESYINRVPNLKLVAICKDAFEVLDVLKKEKVDLMFLDINMPELSGISLLKTMPKRPEVILTTAYAEYALEGFELAVKDYLLKPFSFERFLRAILRVQGNSSPEGDAQQNSNESPTKKPEHLIVKSDKKLLRLLPEEIFMVEAYGNYIKIHTDHIVVTPQVLTEFLEKLPDYFLRIHKSHVVNCNEIKSLEGNILVLNNGQAVAVSRSYRKDLLTQLGL